MFLSCRTQQIKSPRTANQHLTLAEIPEGPELLQSRVLQSLVSGECSGGSCSAEPTPLSPAPRGLEAHTGALHSSSTAFGEYKAFDITRNCRSFISEAVKERPPQGRSMDGGRTSTEHKWAEERRNSAGHTGKVVGKRGGLKGSWSVDTKLEKQESH